MKRQRRRRLRLLLNLAAFSLLLFALYLNFAKSESTGIAAEEQAGHTPSVAANGAGKPATLVAKAPRPLGSALR